MSFTDSKTLNLFELQPLEEDFTCIGTARQNNLSTCRSKPARYYREAASTLRHEILTSDQSAEELKYKMQKLAHLCLCHLHQDESVWFTMRWIPKLGEARSHFDNQRTKVTGHSDAMQLKGAVGDASQQASGNAHPANPGIDADSSQPLSKPKNRKGRTPPCNHTARRRSIADEECRICVGDLNETDEPLIWCKNGCGHNFHESCWYEWENSQAAPCGHTPIIKCILCKQMWNWTACRCDEKVSTENTPPTPTDSEPTSPNSASSSAADSQQTLGQGKFIGWGCR